ncbi:MAG: hypothetical protein AB1744_08720, partial [Candidatus Zixiibacteriota bacterium]
QFHQVLLLDPGNQVALKLLGDIEYANGDKIAAIANYERILTLDPHCGGLKSGLPVKQSPVAGVTLTRGPEGDSAKVETAPPKWKIHFYTETIGDLYMKQGHPRQAAEIFRILHQRTENPRLAEKLAQAEEKIRDREH